MLELTSSSNMGGRAKLELKSSSNLRVRGRLELKPSSNMGGPGRLELKSSSNLGARAKLELKSSSNLGVLAWLELKNRVLTWGRAGCPSKEDGYCPGVVGTGGTTATPDLPGPTSRVHFHALPPLPPSPPLPDIDAVAAGGPLLQAARRGRERAGTPDARANSLRRGKRERSCCSQGTCSLHPSRCISCRTSERTTAAERTELLQPRHLLDPPPRLLAACPVAHASPMPQDTSSS